jgi:hypothetical protein
VLIQNGGAMAGVARNIELYNLSYRLAWKHISELRKRQYPNIALLLHDSIRQRLKEGTAEPVLIASEALRDIEKLNGQIDSNEEPPIRTDDRNRLGRTVGFATGLRS